MLFPIQFQKLNVNFYNFHISSNIKYYITNHAHFSKLVILKK